MPPVSALAPAGSDSGTAAALADREEAGWLRRAGEADEAAFLDLYRRYERRVYGLGLRLLGDRGLAEELVQETFVRLWRGASAFRPDRGPVRAYVFTIARRAAVNLWRRPSSRPLTPPPLAERDADDRVDEILIGVTVREALDALAPAHREILDLCVRRDLSQAQAADRLGVPVGTVKSRTHLALRALEQELDRMGVHA